MNNFMAQGGDENSFLIGRPYIDTGLPMADQFENYLKTFTPLECPQDLSNPRITVVFDDPTSLPNSSSQLRLHTAASCVIIVFLFVYNKN
jgi:hypothetical protein